MYIQTVEYENLTARANGLAGIVTSELAGQNYSQKFNQTNFH